MNERSKTYQNIAAAIGHEAVAICHYREYGKIAKKSGQIELSKFYEKIAHNEELHFQLLVRELKELNNDQNNLIDAMNSEHETADIEYTLAAKDAIEDGEDRLAEMFIRLKSAELGHLAEMKLRFKQLFTPESIKPISDTLMWICEECGNIIVVTDREHPENDRPLVCPLCGHQDDYKLYNQYFEEVELKKE